MKTLIIANWKMYLNNQETLELVENMVHADWNISSDVDVVICPSFVMLSQMHALHQHKMFLGAQDVFWENTGAHTGEVGPEQLKDLGVEYVIIGHSERRAQLAESGEMINKKIKASIEADITPILCIGEDYEVHAANLTEDKIIKQLHAALKDVSLVKGNLIIAYEPVWAIYPSKYQVDPDYVRGISGLIEKELKSLLGESVYQERCQIIYGGSVNSENIKQFLNLPLISGALIGHASTNFEEFGTIIGISSPKDN